MDLEERSLEDPFEGNCQVCGTPLKEQEIHRSREAGGPFLCSVHANEELPAIEGSSVGEPDTPDNPVPEGP
jgi:hypothetical protein